MMRPIHLNVEYESPSREFFHALHADDEQVLWHFASLNSLWPAVPTDEDMTRLFYSLDFRVHSLSCQMAVRNVYDWTLVLFVVTRLRLL